MWERVLIFVYGSGKFNKYRLENNWAALEDYGHLAGLYSGRVGV